MPSLSSVAVSHLLTITLAVLSSVHGGESAGPRAPVTLTVTFADGSTVTSIADAETDDQFLTLRSSTAGIFIRRFVPWDHVATADTGEEILNSSALKNYLKNSQLDTGPQSLAEIGHSIVTNSDRRSNHLVSVATPAAAPVVGQQAWSDSVRSRVTSLEFSAIAANWDRDAPFDGMRVLVRPLNIVGEVVPVNGYIRVKLFGQRHLPVGSVRRNHTADVYPTLENWSCRVRKQDFSIDGATYRFSYRRAKPDSADNLSSIGLTHASLSIPGLGVFRASGGMTNLRSDSRYRNWHQRLTDQRFLPGERVAVPR